MQRRLFIKREKCENMEKLIILLYHRVCELKDDFNLLSVTPGNFMKQMRYLKEHYHIVRMDEDWDQIREPSVMITFDDGFQDAYTEALPILEALQIPATFFITTGNISTSKELWQDSLIRFILVDQTYRPEFTLQHDIYGHTWKTETIEERYRLYRVMHYLFQRANAEERQDWLRQLAAWNNPDRAEDLLIQGRTDRRSMSEGQLKLLSQNKLVTIGAHTVNHVALSRQPEEVQRKEIADSRSWLERLTGKEAAYFSYPFGSPNDYSEKTVEIVRELGFKKACAVFPGIVTKDTDPYRIPRYIVRNWEMDVFSKKIQEGFGGEIGECRLTEGKIEYFGSLEDDWELQLSQKPIVIWGTGKKGKSILERLKKYRIYADIAAWGDNNAEKVGTEIEGIRVIGLKELVAEYKDAYIIIGSTYERELIAQMNGAGMRHIRLYI